MSSENEGTGQSGLAPLLVMVGGAPGSGKTTLAGRLAAELSLPVLLRDELKEALFDTLGSPDRERARQLGVASYELLRLVAGRLVAARVSMIIESNFRRGLSEAWLVPLLVGCRGVQIHCEGVPAVIRARIHERIERGERHPGHHDLVDMPRLQQELDAGLFQPLALAVPTLRVDTTTDLEYCPSFEEIVAFVRGGARS